MENHTYRVAHEGRGGELFAIFIVNILLTILTLGIYKFWAKTRVRRYLWSHSSVDGERLEYGGTGMELFLGFLTAMAFFVLGGLLIFLLVMAAQSLAPHLIILAVLVAYAAMLILPGIALFSARRYKLSRTRWRGIRFGQSGSALRFALMMLGYGLLTGLTLGLYGPFMRTRLTAYSLGNTWFGNEQVSFTGRGKDLFGRYLLAYLLTLPTLGLYWFWYLAAEARYFAEHTRFQNARFAAVTLTGGGLLKLALVNLLLLVITLGLAWPWVVVRTARFYAAHYSLQGALDFAAISRSRQVAPRTGEGLIEAFDMGAI